MVEEFADELDIESEPIILDGRVSDSEGMGDLRKQLQISADKIRASKKRLSKVKNAVLLFALPQSNHP